MYDSTNLLNDIRLSQRDLTVGHITLFIMTGRKQIIPFIQQYVGIFIINTCSCNKTLSTVNLMSVEKIVMK